MITNTCNIRPMLGMPGMIEAQEAQGQRELVTSTQLPTDIDAKSKAALEAAGVVFGVCTPGDPMFRSATLPPGWKKVPTDHSMWTDLVDEQGRQRGRIFYKAAFYDRSAHMYAVTDALTPVIANEEEV